MIEVPDQQWEESNLDWLDRLERDWVPLCLADDVWRDIVDMLITRLRVEWTDD